MHKLIIRWIAVAQLIGIVCLAGPSKLTDYVEVSGIVFDPDLIAIPGLKVSAVSEKVRQKAIYTDNGGRFTLRVPVGETADWYVEILWNTDLMFLKKLRDLRIKDEGANFGSDMDRGSQDRRTSGSRAHPTREKGVF